MKSALCQYRIKRGSRYICRMTRQVVKRVSDLTCTGEVMNECARKYYAVQMRYPLGGSYPPRDEPMEPTGES